MNCGRQGCLMAFQDSSCLTDQTLRWQRRLRVRLFVNSYFSASINIRTRGVQAGIIIRIWGGDARGKWRRKMTNDECQMTKEGRNPKGGGWSPIGRGVIKFNHARKPLNWTSAFARGG